MLIWKYIHYHVCRSVSLFIVKRFQLCFVMCQVSLFSYFYQPISIFTSILSSFPPLYKLYIFPFILLLLLFRYVFASFCFLLSILSLVFYHNSCTIFHSSSLICFHPCTFTFFELTVSAFISPLCFSFSSVYLIFFISSFFLPFIHLVAIFHAVDANSHPILLLLSMIFLFSPKGEKGVTFPFTCVFTLHQSDRHQSAWFHVPDVSSNQHWIFFTVLLVSSPSHSQERNSLALEVPSHNTNNTEILCFIHNYSARVKCLTSVVWSHQTGEVWRSFFPRCTKT